MTQESVTHEPWTHNMPLHCTTHHGGTVSCSASSGPMLSVRVHDVSTLFLKNYTGHCLILYSEVFLQLSASKIN